MLKAVVESLFVLAFFLPPLAVLLGGVMLLLQPRRPRRTLSTLMHAA